MTQHSQNGEAVEVQKALIDTIISMYHTMRFSEVKAADHILSKDNVQAAFARYRQSLARESATADVGRVALEARDTAQSAVEAWAEVFEGLEAHLQDRIAMQDEGSPATYLSIIRSSVANVLRASVQIRAARWTDYNRQSWRIAELEAQIAAHRLATPSSDVDAAIATVRAHAARLGVGSITIAAVPAPSSGHAMAEGERLRDALMQIIGGHIGDTHILSEDCSIERVRALAKKLDDARNIARRALATTQPTTNDAIPAEGEARLTRLVGECFSGMPERMSQEPIRCGMQHLGTLWSVSNDIARKVMAAAPSAPATSDSLPGRGEVES